VSIILNRFQKISPQPNIRRLFVLKSVQTRVHQSDVEDSAKKQNQIKSQLKSTDGVQLAFTNETDVYFRQLDLLWS
jgi:hypothetical protein